MAFRTSWDSGLLFAQGSEIGRVCSLVLTVLRFFKGFGNVFVVLVVVVSLGSCIVRFLRVFSLRTC